MKESQRMVSGKLGGKTCLYAYPKLQCTVQKFGKIFVATLSMELNGILACKWNSERVIIFHLVIMLQAQGDNNAKHICVRILF